jgi:glycosyltransferase involved in cell wall biosynthesis
MGRRVNSPPSFVCFSIFDWWYHGRGHSDFQLMTKLAEGHRVLFVNSIGMRMPVPGRTGRALFRIARKARSISKFLCSPLPDLPMFYVLSPLILPWYGNITLRAWHARIVAVQVRFAMRRAGIVRPIYVVTVPTAWEVLQHLEPGFVVYNRSDKHSAFSEGERAFIEGLEHELLRSAGLVVYASPVLLGEERAMVGERGYFLDHGVDWERFYPRCAEPRAVAGIARPRVGFLGDLRNRVIDFDLLEHLARELPAVQLLLVGAASDDVRSLTRLPNVHWLGFWDYERIPALMQALDVGLLPYRATEWVEYINPVKLKEYLAAGLRVVSTDFPAARAAGGAVTVAVDPDSFVAEVARTLAEPSAGAPVVLDHSWSWRSRADEVLRECEARRV